MKMKGSEPAAQAFNKYHEGPVTRWLQALSELSCKSTCFPHFQAITQSNAPYAEKVIAADLGITFLLIRTGEVLLTFFQLHDKALEFLTAAYSGALSLFRPLLPSHNTSI